MHQLLSFGLVAWVVITGVLTAAAPADAWQRRGRGPVRQSITFVVDRDNLPYGTEANEETPGINVEIARALGQELDRTVYYRWINSLFESSLEQVLLGEADCAVGVPYDTMQVEDDIGRIGNQVLWTIPYYGTGYVLVSKPGAQVPGSLRKLGGQTVGTERGALVSYRLRDWGVTPEQYLNQMAILLALSQGKVALGALWADAGWLLKENPVLGLAVAPGYMPETGLRVNVAAAVRPDQTALAEQINAALRRMIESGAVRDIVTKYGVPYYPPFREGE
jgi:ABC-type amino acid transport substrate-binding protein